MDGPAEIEQRLPGNFRPTCGGTARARRRLASGSSILKLFMFLSKHHRHEPDSINSRVERRNTIFERLCFVLTVVRRRRSGIGHLPTGLLRQVGTLREIDADAVLPCGSSVPGYHKLHQRSDGRGVHHSTSRQFRVDPGAKHVNDAYRVHPKPRVGSVRGIDEAGRQTRLWRGEI